MAVRRGCVRDVGGGLGAAAPSPVSAPQRVARDRGPAWLGLQRPTRALEFFASVGVGELAHFRAAKLVASIVNQSLYVEPVENKRRVRHHRLHGLDVRAGHVDRDRLQLGAPLGAQLLEERNERRGVLARIGIMQGWRPRSYWKVSCRASCCARKRSGDTTTEISRATRTPPRPGRFRGRVAARSAAGWGRARGLDRSRRSVGAHCFC